ncbi:hypothetical protein AA0111_g3798 [Alternaria arborescens]|uniref:hypothetical protein n=1 Tax=Alternaria arborescens TaxID=156630 RepID=UPI001074E2FA|nr:hypothetical protein AA0111_g3798 [Alternaria arborescens]RYO33517.1 hypothetical protein AA0111_g3798 [Alternaria arborescens]
MSPPILTATGFSPPPPSTNPISPVSRSGTFPHKTSPAVVTQTPLIDTNTPAINDAPVELDGGEVTPEELRRRTTEEASGVRGSMRSPDEEGIDAEFLGEGENLGRDAREKRAAMLASRSKDPSVIVDVPKEPTAEEVEAARKADALLPPGMRGKIPEA